MPPVPKAKAAKKPAPEAAPLLHAALRVEVANGDAALTAEKCKELLGWTEETETHKFGDDFLLTDLNGTKVRCLRDTRNRPLSMTWVKTLALKHLKKQWRLNGEPVIIGNRGEVLSAQHRLISVVFAEQMRLSEKDKDYWKKAHPEPVKMDTVIVYGVAEDDSTVNTLDTGRPRTLSDVIYRSDYFSKMNPQDRKAAARAAAHAVRMLWGRTGAGDAYSPYQTHEEMLDFLDRHPKLLVCVKHVVGEDGGEGRIGKYIGVGYAAGLMYLMAASASDGEKYRKGNPPSEKKCDLGNMDKAEEFWTCFSSVPEFKCIKEAVARLHDPDTGAGGSTSEIVGTVVKAWNIFEEAKKPPKNAAELALEYDRPEGEPAELVDFPCVGGIDQGDPREPELDEDTAADATAAEKATAADDKPATASKAPPTTKKPAAPAANDAERKALADMLEPLRKDHPDSVLLFLEPGDNLSAYGGDAMRVAKTLKSTVSQKAGGSYFLATASAVDTLLDQFKQKGVDCRIVVNGVAYLPDEVPGAGGEEPAAEEGETAEEITEAPEDVEEAAE